MDFQKEYLKYLKEEIRGLNFGTIFLLLFEFIKLSATDTSIQTTEEGSFISLTLGKRLLVSLWRECFT